MGLWGSSTLFLRVLILLSACKFLRFLQWIFITQSSSICMLVRSLKCVVLSSIRWPVLLRITFVIIIIINVSIDFFAVYFRHYYYLAAEYHHCYYFSSSWKSKAVTLSTFSQFTSFLWHFYYYNVVMFINPLLCARHPVTTVILLCLLCFLKRLVKASNQL